MCSCYFQLDIQVFNITLMFIRNAWKTVRPRCYVVYSAHKRCISQETHKSKFYPFQTSVPSPLYHWFMLICRILSAKRRKRILARSGTIIVFKKSLFLHHSTFISGSKLKCLICMDWFPWSSPKIANDNAVMFSRCVWNITSLS